MSNLRTRREFMKWTAGGVAGAAVGNALPLAAEPTRSRPARDIDVRLTSGTKRFAQEYPLQWRPAPGTAADIVLDPTRTYQELLGFGAAFTDAACYMFHQLAPEACQGLFHELFHPSEMGFSIGRTCVGSSDYSNTLYSYDEGEPDPELKRFSIAHDREYILPMLRIARQVNPDLFLLASPWSPPGWMKANGSMLGGSMKKSYYGVYANYLEKFLRAYAAEGVEINALTPQNEVDTDQDGRMPACLWGQEYEMEFVARHLGPQLTAGNLKTSLWILDHNYNLWGRAICELDDPDVNKYVDGVAWHGYAGKPDDMTRVHRAYPSKHAYWTEGGPECTDPAYLTDWTKWSTAFTGILRNWSRCIIGWNLALDQKGKPNIGPFSCGGVVTINSQSKEIARSGQYWAFAHYSRTLRRGARRFESRGDVTGVSHVAFANPEGSHVLVLTNERAQRTIRLQLGDMISDVSMPRDSVMTLSW